MSAPDKRITKTKKAIDAAFWSLMEQVDFREITVNDVAARAEISRTTFYRHYSDKSYWLEQALLDRLQDHTADAAQIPGSDRDILIRKMARILHSISCDRQLCTLIQLNTNHQLMYRFFLDRLLADFHQRHSSQADPTPEESLGLHYIAASSSALIEWWVRNDTLFTPEQLAQCIYSFHHRPE